jgi:predicted transcriptional regulator
MRKPKLTKAELEIMQVLWNRGALSVREIQDAFPEQKRPAFTTVQTVVYRLEAKKAIRIAKKVGNANVFEPVMSRTVAGNSLIDDLLGFFGGRVEPVIARLIESGKLTMEDIKEAEEALRSLSRKDKRK